MISPAPNTCRLNIQPLSQFRPHRGFLLARSTLPTSVARLLHTAGICNLANADLTFHTCAPRSGRVPRVNLQRDKWLRLSGRERVL